MKRVPTHLILIPFLLLEAAFSNALQQAGTGDAASR